MPPLVPLRTSGTDRGTTSARAPGAVAFVLVLAATLCPAVELPRRPPPPADAAWDRAAADTVIVAPTADTAAVWSHTMRGFSATHPVARATAPDVTSRPPRPGTIESAWVALVDGPRQPTWPHWPAERERIVVHVVPTSAGTVVMGAVERQSFAGGTPAYAPLPDEFVGNVVQAANWEDAMDEDSARGLPSAGMPADGFYEPPVVDDSFGLDRDPPWSHAAHPRLAGALYRVTDDYLNFYGCRSLAGIGIATGVAAIMANTNFDGTVQASWQRNVSPTGLGEFFSGCRNIGNGFYSLPVFGAAATLCLFGEDHPVLYTVGEWGARSLRSFFVGAPFMLLMQEATGGSRPGESSGSRWRSFADNNGVSGHAFMGAIPFLAAADMAERPLVKAALYVGSTFVAFSRMTDDVHYPSQAFLGWYIAFAAAQAVDTTEAQIADMQFRVVPLAMAGLDGLAVEARW